MTDLLSYVEVETAPQPDAAVIWLHGLGSDGHDFESIVPAFSLTANIRFIFPHAPKRPVTINGGMLMRAWYDIYEMTLDRKVDMANIDESSEQIEALIEDQVQKGISPDRIVLAGFSQGGVIAYNTALRNKRKLAGILALSTYLVKGDEVPDAKDCANGMTPILIHHGSQDPVVVPALGDQAKELLVSRGFDVSYLSYNMPHSVCPEQVQDISNWLNACLT